MSLYLGNEIFEIQTLPLTNYTHLYVRQVDVFFFINS